MFNSREYEWADITVVLGGRDITGLRSIRYKESQEKEAVYGKGNRPQAIQKGNKSYEGSIVCAYPRAKGVRAYPRPLRGGVGVGYLAQRLFLDHRAKVKRQESSMCCVNLW